MMKRPIFSIWEQLLALFALAGLAQAATITVPNASFEDTTGIASTEWNNGSGPGGNGEVYTSPSNFGPGWALSSAGGSVTFGENGIGTNGKFGLQQPRNESHSSGQRYFFERENGIGVAGNLVGPFSGNLIGFVNLDNDYGQTLDANKIEYFANIQSGILGNLQQGKYVLNVGVGARGHIDGAASGPINWNDLGYDVSLVANPSVLGNGTTGGTVLGTPASVVLAPFSETSGVTAVNNTHDLMYMLTVDAGDANIGSPYAVRIRAANNQTKNGVADPNSPDGDLRFTQAAFDNVRLSHFVPEPGSLLLLGFATLGLLFVHHRRGA
jgi:HpiC1 cyclase/PEP-CTERM motif